MYHNNAARNNSWPLPIFESNSTFDQAGETSFAAMLTANIALP